MLPVLIAARVAYSKIPELYAASPALRSAINAGIERIAGDSPAPGKTKDAMFGLFTGDFSESIKAKSGDLVREGMFSTIKESLLSAPLKDSSLMHTLIQAGTALISLAIATLTQLTERAKQTTEVAAKNNSAPAQSVTAGISTQDSLSSHQGGRPVLTTEAQRKADLEWEIYLLKAANRDLEKAANKAETIEGIHPGVAKDFRQQIKQNNIHLESKKADLAGFTGTPLQKMFSESSTPSITITPSAGFTKDTANKEAASPSLTRESDLARSAGISPQGDTPDIDYSYQEGPTR